MGYISCDPHIYDKGGFYDDPQLLDEFRRRRVAGIQTVGELFPSYSYTRAMPATANETDEASEATLLDRYRRINSENGGGAASALVELDDAILAGGVIYLQRDGRREIVYETHRPSDRKDSKLLGAEVPIPETVEKDRGLYLYLGSVGSFNYGHWLTDDAARVRAFFVLRELFRDGYIHILLPTFKAQTRKRFSGHWDRKRVEAIRFMLNREKRYSVGFVDSTSVRRFERLYYPTPVSYHPVLKSPDALQMVAESFERPVRIYRWSRREERIFVLRRPIRGRVLENMEELRALMDKYRFKVVDTERMSVQQQASVFARARVVVGVMGAAMVNTLFCKRDAHVIHLAPSGWTEPYYWDLAALRGHRYNVCFGAGTDARLGHMTPFRISPSSLVNALEVAC